MIEFDETGQVLRLKNAETSSETNATLSVLAARLRINGVMTPSPSLDSGCCVVRRFPDLRSWLQIVLAKPPTASLLGPER